MDFTLLEGGRAMRVEATVADGRVALAPAVVARELGWRLEAQGLCRGDVCVPVRDRDALVGPHGLDLAALAGLLNRPLALDAEQRVAALGTAAAERAASLASLEAPDFTLPDLEGQLHSLSDHRGKKVLLVAYASW